MNHSDESKGIASHSKDQVISNLPTPIFESDLSGCFTFVNTEWSSLTGLEQGETLGHGWIESIHPEDRQRVVSAWNQSIVKKEHLDITYRVKRLDNVTRNVRFRSSVIKTQNGHMFGFAGSLQDITEQVRVSCKLENATDELYQFFNMAEEVLCIMAFDGTFRKINPKFLSILGQTEKNVIGFKVFDFLHPSEKQKMLDCFTDEVNETNKFNIEARVRNRTGNYKLLSWSFSYNEVNKCRYAVARDITEQRSNEAEIKQLVDAIDQSAIVAITDKSGKIRRVNDKFCNVSGYSQQELIGQDHRLLNSGSHPKEFFTNLWRRISTGQIWTGEIRNKAKDGRNYYVQTVISPLKNDQGHIDRFLSIRFDVSQQKQMEAQLEAAQSTAKVGSWEFNAITGELKFSKQLIKMLSPLDSVSVQSLEDLFGVFDTESHGLFRQSFGQCLSQGTNNSFRLKIQNIDNPCQWTQVTIEASSTANGKVHCITGTIQDITDLVNAEDRAKLEHAKSIQNGKLATIGELSSGISHEINNPLAVIMGYVKAISLHPDDKTKVAMYAKSIEKAGDRISKIINGMRKYSRTSSSNSKSHMSLSTVIKDALEMVEIKAKKFGTDVEFICSSDITFPCNEVEMGQVIINLVANAIDATKDLEKRWVRIELFANDVTVNLHIIDAGKGIPQPTVEKMFQPFFTTKPVGEGTGLGLSIAKGIIEDHKGVIEVEASHPNTCFSIKFPVELAVKSAA